MAFICGKLFTCEYVNRNRKFSDKQFLYPLNNNNSVGFFACLNGTISEASLNFKQSR